MLAKRSVRLSLLGAGAVSLSVLLAWLVAALFSPASAPAALLNPPPPADLPLGSPRVPSPSVADAPATDAPAKTFPAPPRPTSSQTKVPSRPTTPTRRPTTPSALTATLAVNSSWADGYVAEIRVTNAGTTALPWTVTVSNASRLNVTLTNAWNATVTQNGDTIVLRGEPLAAGVAIAAGYQVSATAGSNPRPSTCVLTGSTCRRV